MAFVSKTPCDGLADLAGTYNDDPESVFTHYRGTLYSE
jgi:hypothetical protein